MKDKLETLKENYLLVNKEQSNYEKLKENLEKLVTIINKTAFVVLAFFVTLVAVKMCADALGFSKEIRENILKIRDLSFDIAIILFITNIIMKIRLLVLEKLKK